MFILKQFIIFRIVRPNKWVSESTPLNTVFKLFINRYKANESMTDIADERDSLLVMFL